MVGRSPLNHLGWAEKSHEAEGHFSLSRETPEPRTRDPPAMLFGLPGKGQMHAFSLCDKSQLGQKRISGFEREAGTWVGDDETTVVKCVRIPCCLGRIGVQLCPTCEMAHGR